MFVCTYGEIIFFFFFKAAFPISEVQDSIPEAGILKRKISDVDSSTASDFLRGSINYDVVGSW